MITLAGIPTTLLTRAWKFSRSDPETICYMSPGNGFLRWRGSLLVSRETRRGGRTAGHLPHLLDSLLEAIVAITRRRLLHHGAALGGCAALGPWLAPSWASPTGLAERAIPASGERLPVIGLGTSRTFNVAPGSVQFTPLLDVLKVSVDGGLKVIDTAPSYGQAEAVTGELVARSASRERLFLATKVSSTGREAGQRQIEASFRALQAERIDLIQVHNLQDTVTQLATLNALKQQGRIRYTGLTHYLDSAHDALVEALGKHKVDFVQFNYSVGSRSAEKRLLPFCAEHGIAVLINRAYQAGELFERVKGQPLPA
jgi:diketogulonate reductase-like aldo/keto reductase